MMDILPEITKEMRFDFILHTHVIEHEPDPIASLARLRNHIAPSGRLYLELPFEFWERILSRRPGAIWHVNFFNSSTLFLAARKTGWKFHSLILKKLPYSFNNIPCIVCILTPDEGNYSPDITIKTGTFITDFYRFVKFRLIS